MRAPLLPARALPGCVSTSAMNVVTAPSHATARAGTAVVPGVTTVQSATLPTRSAAGAAAIALWALSSTPSPEPEAPKLP